MRIIHAQTFTRTSFLVCAKSQKSLMVRIRSIVGMKKETPKPNHPDTGLLGDSPASNSHPPTTSLCCIPLESLTSPTCRNWARWWERYFSSLTLYEDKIQGPGPCPSELRVHTLKLEGKISVSMEMMKQTCREKFRYCPTFPGL